MGRSLCALMAAAVAALASGAAAAEQPVGGPSVTISASDYTLAQAAAALAKSSGIPVVADPASSAKISASFTNTPIEQVLDSLGKIANIDWQKVFVAAESGEQALAKEALAKAREQAAILKQLSPAPKAPEGAPALAPTTMVVYDPAAKAQITVTVQPADSQKASEAAASLGLKPAYVLMSKDPSPASKAGSAPTGVGAEAYADLTRQQNHQFLQMSPQERVQALQQSMQNDLTLSPAELAEMTRARMEAYHTLMQSDSKVVDQWRQQRHDAWGTLRESGALPDFGGGRDGGRGRDRGGDRGGGMMGPGF